MPTETKTDRTFEVKPRPDGSWRLSLMEGTEDMGGGVFPADEYSDAVEEGQSWCDVQQAPSNSAKLREEWLLRVAAALEPTFKRLGYTLSKYRVSCGFTGASKASIGVCYSPTVSKDSTTEIFVHPSQSEPLEVAAVLAHELGHAAVGNEHHHDKTFRKCALTLGLVGPSKATRPGPGFTALWSTLSEAIGPYPHAALGGGGELISSEDPKQGTRMVKVSCSSCGYTLRTTQKWIDIAIPTCPNPECDMQDTEMEVGGNG